MTRNLLHICSKRAFGTGAAIGPLRKSACGRDLGSTPEWRNRQTRRIQNPVLVKGVRVRVPPLAPPEHGRAPRCWCIGYDGKCTMGHYGSASVWIYDPAANTLDFVKSDIQPLSTVYAIACGERTRRDEAWTFRRSESGGREARKSLPPAGSLTS